MPKPLSEQDKEKVIGEYLKNQSYRKISESTDVSLGAVSTVINEARSVYPDLDLLRDIRSKLPEDVDVQTLHKTILAILEFQNVIQIPLKDIPSYIEDKQKEIKDLSAKKDNLTIEIQDLESKRESLQSEVKQLSERKTQLGKDIQDYEDMRKHLAEYGINIKDIDRLRSLLDNINKYGLDIESCVSVVQEHGLLFKENQGMRNELGELTLYRDALRFSLSSLEYQHAQASMKLRLKLKAVEMREQEIQMLDKHISQLKGELQNLENRKEVIIAETFMERQKRQEMLEAYRFERDNLKSEVNSLKAEISELNKTIAEKSEQIEELDEKIDRLKKSIEHYKQSETMKELQWELDIAQLRFFNLAYKTIEKNDTVLAKHVVDDIISRLRAIEEKLEIKQKSIVTLAK